MSTWPELHSGTNYNYVWDVDTLTWVKEEPSTGEGGVSTHNLLDSTVHLDTETASVAQGDLIVGDATPKWAALPIGDADQVLTSDGTTASWQDLPAVAASSTTMTTTSTGTVNDFDLDSSNVILRCNNASLLTLTGFTVNGTTPSDGDRVQILSINNHVFFGHQTGSTAANQLINLATSGPTPIYGGSATYIYDGTTGKWRLVHHFQGEFIQVAYNSGNFTANGGMTWTVDSGDVEFYGWYLQGKQLQISMSIFGSSVTAPLSDTLQLTIPNGFTANTQGGTVTRSVCTGSNSGTSYLGNVRVANGATICQIRNSGAGAPNWTAATNTTHVYMDTSIPVA